jgi:hypothetical protein
VGGVGGTVVVQFEMHTGSTAPQICGKLLDMTKNIDHAKSCPECDHQFQGNGWDGIDAHWRSQHAHIMRYEDAWPLIQSGQYKRRSKPQREDFSQTVVRNVREATEDK